MWYAVTTTDQPGSKATRLVPEPPVCAGLTGSAVVSCEAPHVVACPTCSHAGGPRSGDGAREGGAVRSHHPLHEMEEMMVRR